MSLDGPLGRAYSSRVPQDVTEFDELINLVRGMRGQLVEAGVYLPWDEGRYPVAHFAGTLREVEHQKRTNRPRWVLTWAEDKQPEMLQPQLALWERRFVRAELSFTGDADEDLAEMGEGRGHNIFLKIYSEGWIVDLTGYV